MVTQTYLRRTGRRYMEEIRGNFERFYRNKYLFPFFLILFFIWSVIATDFNPKTLAEGFPNLVDFVWCMFPPDFDAFPSLINPAMETVQMAFLGTLFASLISFPLSILASNNITTSGLARNTSKSIIAFTRTVPDIVFALIFVSAVGLGPFPGTLALAIHSIGMLGKLYAEAIEEIDPQPLEAVEAVGANKIQSIRYAVIPQILPSFVANTLYRFDVNVRSSIVLGLVGAGGIGFELILAMRLFRYKELASILIIIFIIILLSEKISDALRKRIIGEEVLK
ncbi:MAG TPA: phosphonate ABC transporter, permease protein PhnE [Methanophagales archaeon]|nr:phosphonate ABC transporter, permease protein PhnE [Methanophagales archaeon]